MARRAGLARRSLTGVGTRAQADAVPPRRPDAVLRDVTALEVEGGNRGSRHGAKHRPGAQSAVERASRRPMSEHATIHAEARMGPRCRLRVADLERSPSTATCWPRRACTAASPVPPPRRRRNYRRHVAAQRLADKVFGAAGRPYRPPPLRAPTRTSALADLVGRLWSESCRSTAPLDHGGASHLPCADPTQISGRLTFDRDRSEWFDDDGEMVPEGRPAGTSLRQPA